MCVQNASFVMQYQDPHRSELVTMRTSKMSISLHEPRSVTHHVFQHRARMSTGYEEKRYEGRKGKQLECRCALAVECGIRIRTQKRPKECNHNQVSTIVILLVLPFRSRHVHHVVMFVDVSRRFIARLGSSPTENTMVFEATPFCLE